MFGNSTSPSQRTTGTNQTPLLELLNITDTLLDVARLPNPDLDLILQLLRERGEKLSQLPMTDLSDARERLEIFQRILAAVAELRDLFQERHRAVSGEMHVLTSQNFRRLGRTPHSPVLNQRT